MRKLAGGRAAWQHVSHSPCGVWRGGPGCSCCHCVCSGSTVCSLRGLAFCSDTYFVSQLSATDISAQAPMKGAAKCDNHCELQNSVNQWILERALHSRDIPGSMPASVLVEPSCRCGPSCVHSPASLCAMAALSGGASGTCRSVRRELQLLQLVSLHHTFVTDSCGAPTNSS